MSILAARIDYRLIHGIVSGFWVPMYKPQRLMVIDDKSANDPVLKESLKIGRPVGTALSILNEETAYENFKNGKYNNQTLFVVTSRPEIIRNLMNLGEKLPILNVGLTLEPKDCEYTRISNRAFIRKDEEDVYKEILSKGTEVIAQYVPDDKPIQLASIINL